MQIHSPAINSLKIHYFTHSLGPQMMYAHKLRATRIGMHANSAEHQYANSSQPTRAQNNNPLIRGSAVAAAGLREDTQTTVITTVWNYVGAHGSKHNSNTFRWLRLCVGQLVEAQSVRPKSGAFLCVSALLCVCVCVCFLSSYALALAPMRVCAHVLFHFTTLHSDGAHHNNQALPPFPLRVCVCARAIK